MAINADSIDLTYFKGNRSPMQPANTGLSVVSTSNAAVAITLNAQAGVQNVFAGVSWSYLGGTVAGNIKVEDGSGNIIWQADLAATGPGSYTPPFPIVGTPNTAMIFTLAAGGSGVTGKLNASAFSIK